MDPTATLIRIHNALIDGDLAEATEASEDLAEWLGKGGFAPIWSDYPAATQWLQEQWGVDSIKQY